MIKFGYCAGDNDLGQYQGAQYDVIFLDEATQLSEWQMKQITACLRGVNAFPKRMYYTCNPGGQGHSYIKRIFIEKKYEAGERPEDYTFIQSLVTDNKALMAAQPDYIHQLEALPEKLRKAWLEGDCIAELQARFDIAAIGVACALGYLDLRQPEWDWRGRYPRLAAWFAEVSQRPSMQATRA